MRARTWIIGVLLTTPLSAQQKPSDSPSPAVAAGAYRVLPPAKLSIVTVSTALQSDVSARPNYAAPIYGAPFGSIPDLPQGLPPFFVAIAQDDSGAGALVDRFYAALLAKGYRPELHRFQCGGHGFGMSRRFTSSDHWIDSFFWWMEANGLTRKPGDPERPIRPTPTGRSGRNGASR
jgi:acetyl esterase/lipase